MTAHEYPSGPQPAGACPCCMRPCAAGGRHWNVSCSTLGAPHLWPRSVLPYPAISELEPSWHCFCVRHKAPLSGWRWPCAIWPGFCFAQRLPQKIHRAARRSGQYGLIDFLIHQHGIRNRLAIWAPFAIVFRPTDLGATHGAGADPGVGLCVAR